jgi:hypothetical protein
MNHQVKIKVRHNQPVHFPPFCVHCAQPAAARMGLRRRIGRLTRMVDVPLCKECHYELRRRSAKEERLQKIGWLVSGVLFLLAVAFTLVFTPAEFGFALRLLLAALLALGLAGFVFWLFWRAGTQAELPSKRAIRQSAAIANFSWRATTFEFDNEKFAEQFRAMNEARLMEI